MPVNANSYKMYIPTRSLIWTPSALPTSTSKHSSVSLRTRSLSSNLIMDFPAPTGGFSGETCFVMVQPNCLIKYNMIDRRIETSYVERNELSAFLVSNGIKSVDDQERIRLKFGFNFLTRPRMYLSMIFLLRALMSGLEG